jgi:hypothetical protein
MIPDGNILVRDGSFVDKPKTYHIKGCDNGGEGSSKDQYYPSKEDLDRAKVTKHILDNSTLLKVHPDDLANYEKCFPYLSEDDPSDKGNNKRKRETSTPPLAHVPNNMTTHEKEIGNYVMNNKRHMEPSEFTAYEWECYIKLLDQELEHKKSKIAYMSETVKLEEQRRAFELNNKSASTAPLTPQQSQRLQEGLDALKAEEVADANSREQTPEGANKSDSDSAPECGPLEKGKGVSKRK